MHTVQSKDRRHLYRSVDPAPLHSRSLRVEADVHPLSRVRASRAADSLDIAGVKIVCSFPMLAHLRKRVARVLAQRLGQTRGMRRDIEQTAATAQEAMEWTAVLH